MKAQLLFYNTVAKLVNLGLRVYFRKIYFYNEEVVNLDKPVLIASNHPTAFIEPLIIGSTLKKPVYFLVRADIFREGILKYFTDALGMIPIFRFVDGFSNMKNNQDIFRMLYKKLSNDNVIVVFAEGTTTQQKRLGPIKKGTARLAFGAYEKHGVADLDIIPAGVNYTYPNQYRKEVMVEFGEPIRMADYMDVYHEHPNRAIMQLTKELQKRMKTCVIGIDSKEDEALAEQHFVLHRSHLNNNIFPVRSSSNSELRSEWQIADDINQMEAGEKAQLKTRTQSYFDHLSKYKLQDRSLVNGNKSFNVVNTLLLFFGFIPMLIGTIANAFPIIAANLFVKSKIKSLEFEAPVRFAGGLGLYLVYWLVLFVIALVNWNPFLIGFVLLMPFLGFFAVNYYDIFRKWNADRHFVFVENAVREELEGERESLLQDSII